MRKLLSVVIAVCMLFSALPTVFAVDVSGTVIESVSVNDVVTELYNDMCAGDYSDCTLVSTGCAVKSCKWFDDTASKYVSDDDEFTEDHEYSFHIVVTPDEDYSFADDLAVIINGDSESVDYVVHLADGSVRIETVTFRCARSGILIDRVEINDVVLELHDGMVASECVDLTFDSDKCKLTSAVWLEAPGYPLFEDDQFTEGKSYYMVITLNAIEGFIFSDDTVVTINGSENNVRSFMLTSYGDFIISTHYIVCDEAVGTTIETVEISGVATELHDGQSVGDYLSCAMNNPFCTVKSTAWFDDTASKYAADDDTFVLDHEYSFHVVLTAKEGYEFADDVAVIINGSADNTEYIVHDADGSVRVESALVKCGENLGAIDHVALEDVVTELRDGMTVGECSGCICASDDYSVANFIWLEKEAGPMLSDNLPFVEEHIYYAVITLEPGEGHIFTDDTTVAINGSEDMIDECMITYYGDITIRTINIVCKEASDICTPVAVVSITDAETTPKAGERCGDYLSFTIEEDAPYAVTEAFWYDMTNDKKLADDDAFEAGTEYSIAFFVETKEGYCLNEDTVLMLNNSPELHRYSCIEDTRKAWIYSIPEEAVTENTVVTGDVNSDGVINTLDAVAVLKYAAEMIQLDEKQQTAADTNRDGKVNTADAVLILKYAAGMITEF